MKKGLHLIVILLLSKSLFAQTPTFNGNVASIIFSHCTTCHRPGNIAPFPLTNINEVMAGAFAINTVVSERVMPPWAPDPHYNHLAFERALDDSEIQIITDWIAGGMPEGDSALLPDLPDFDELNSIGIPDYEFQIPDFTIQSAQDDYRCFVIHSGFTAAKFIQAIEVIPGNLEVVHHVQVFWDTTGVCQQLDDNDTLPGYTSFFGVGPVPENLLHVWIPGETTYRLPSQFGLYVPANADLIFQIHYAPGFAGEMDSTRVRFYINNSPTARVVSFKSLINYIDIVQGGPFILPPDTVTSFIATDTLPLNHSLIGIFPHMHLLGKSMKGYGITPTHDTIPFYDIPKWSFYWQNIYLFRKVIKIPVGTVFYVEAVYDNTTNNLLNPNSPPQNVGYGEATSDEMLLNFFLITKYQHADQNIIIDSAAFFSNDTGLNAPDDFLPEMVVSPNPVESEFTVSFNLPESGNTQLQQFDLCGRLIRNLFSERMMEAGDYTFSYHTGSLTNGIYFLKLKCGGKSVVSKIAITGK